MWRIRTEEEMEAARTAGMADVSFTQSMSPLFGVPLSSIKVVISDTKPSNNINGWSDSFSVRGYVDAFNFDGSSMLNIGGNWLIQKWMCIWVKNDYLSIVDKHDKINTGDFILTGDTAKEIKHILKSKRGKLYVLTFCDDTIELSKGKVISKELIKDLL